MDNRTSIEVFESHVRIVAPLAAFLGWSAIVAYCFYALPDVFSEVAQRHFPLPSDEKITSNAAAVIAGEDRVGWLQVRYPPVMEPTHDAPFEVIYVGDPRGWSRRSFSGQMTVAIAAASLSIKPEPLEYAFDMDRIRIVGSDNRIWTLVAEKEGNFTIVVRFVVPRGMQAQAVQINGSQLDDISTSFSLPIKVASSYKISTIMRECAAALGSIVSFLLALPLATILLTWYLNKKKKKLRPRKRKTDDGAIDGSPAS
jgi:hypothetical protein